MIQDDDDLVVVRMFFTCHRSELRSVDARGVGARNEAVRVLDATASAVDPEPARVIAMDLAHACG